MSPRRQPAGGSSGTLGKVSALDAARAKDFAAIPKYPDSWIVQGSTQPRETYSVCGKTWCKYDIHYQSVEPDNAKIVNYLTDKLIMLEWNEEERKNESGDLASANLTKDELVCIPAGTAHLQEVSLVGRSAIDGTIAFTLNVPSGSDPFAR